MIEDIFLCYANNRFNENVENLNIFYQAIISNIDATLFNYNPKYLKFFVQSIIDFSKNGAVKSVKKIEKKFPVHKWGIKFYADPTENSEKEVQQCILSNAFDCVFEFRGPFKEYWEKVYERKVHDDSDFEMWGFDFRVCDCCKTNFSEDLPDIVLDKFNIQNDYQLYCFECKQLQFIDLLTSIAEANNLNAILLENNYKSVLFNNFMTAGCSFLQFDFEVLDRQIKIKHNFKNDSTFGQWDFRHFAAYSLFEFLSNNDFKKLKLCHYCNKFYVASDIRQKKCKNEECRKQYEREKKQKQRKNDPVKYY